MPFQFIYIMKKCILFLMLFIISTILQAQDKYGYRWIMLGHDYIDFKNTPTTAGVIEPYPFYSAGEFGTTMCNKFGELMFQTGGCYILNKNLTIMKNGDSINSKYSYLGWCVVSRGDGTFPFHQSCTALPFPQNDSMYIAFNLDTKQSPVNPYPIPEHLYYHIIDMKQENGLGAVIEKRKIAIEDTLSHGFLAATKHGNGIDWWVITPKFLSNCYFSVKVTSDGVQLPIKTCSGDTTEKSDFGGNVTFSPNGKKYVRSFYKDQIYLFDFNNTTGQLSNLIKLKGPDTTDFLQGVQFSTNNRYLYLTRYSKVYQFDLEAPDIQASRTEVGDVTNFPKNQDKGELHEMRLAPDGKIYIASPFSHRFLSVINRPNCAGKLCDFKPYAIEFTRYNYGGLPNIPFFTQPPANYSCDSPTPTDETSESITIYPNPTANQINISSTYAFQTYDIIDITGKTVLKGVLNSKNEISVATLPNGLYFLSLHNTITQTRAVGKFVVKR
jgi:Secretion system C-terminal sorting domain